MDQLPTAQVSPQPGYSCRLLRWLVGSMEAFGPLATRVPRIGGGMRKVLVLTLIGALLSGCGAVPDVDRNSLMGSASGAAVGALVGSAVGGPPAAWLGAAVGSTTGGVIGYLIRPDGCFFENSKGELWQVPCDLQPARAEGCYRGNEIRGLTEVSCPYEWRHRRIRTKVVLGS